MRKISLEGIKSIKAEQKNTGGNDPIAIGNIAKESLARVMDTSDWVRDKLGPSAGIIIEDTRDSSTWKRKL